MTLAKRLSVTRGSFYWHFKDRQDLVHGVLDEWLAWRRRRIASLKPIFEADDAKEALRKVIRIGFSTARYSPRGIRIELAVRDLAVTDPYAALVLEQSDLMRHANTEALYGRLCQDPQRAHLLARATYLIVAGADLMLHGPTRDETQVTALEQLVEELLLGAT